MSEIHSALISANAEPDPRVRASRSSRALAWLEHILRHRSGTVFVLWAVWLSLEYVALGPFSYVRIPENADIHIPARLALARDFAHHDLGYWVPQRAGGGDRLSQLMACNIDALVFLYLPGWLAYGLIMFVQRFVAGYFSFRLARDQLVLGLLPSLYVGLGYSLYSHDVFGGFADTFTLYDCLALPSLPLLLWLLGRLHERRRPTGIAVAAGAGILLALTSGFPLTLFVIFLVVIWFAVIRPANSRSIWLYVSALTVGWIVACAPSLWPMYLNAGGSQRAQWDVTQLRGQLVSEGLTTFRVARDNALALALTVLGLIATRWRARLLLMLFVSMIACVAFGPVHLLVLKMLAGHLGFLSGFTFDRVFLLLPFLASVAAGVALEHIGRGWTIATEEDITAPVLRFQTLLACTALCLVVWQSLLLKQENGWAMKEGSNYASIFERPDLIELQRATAHDAPFRVVSAGDFPDYVWAYGLESADGYVPLYAKRYQEFWEKVIDPVLSTRPWLRDYGYGNALYLFIPETRLPPALSLPAQGSIRFDHNYDLKLLSLANVRFVVSPVELETTTLKLLPSRFRGAQLGLITNSRFRTFRGLFYGYPPGPPLYVYENPSVLPRFFLAGRKEVFAQGDRLLNALQQASVDALRSTAYLESDRPAGTDLADVQDGEGQVALRQYSADRIALDTESDSGKVLIVTNTYNQFWKAEVDGASAAIFPVDRTFQGIHVAAGRHRVVLQYDPPYAIR